MKVKKKSNVPLNSHKEWDESDRQTIQKVQEGLNILEDSIPVNTPNLQWFVQKVEEEKKSLQKRLLMELVWLWCVAAMVWGFGLVLFYNLPILFVIMQIVATLSLPVMVFWQRRVREANNDYEWNAR